MNFNTNINFNEITLAGIVKHTPEFRIHPFFGDSLLLVLSIYRPELDKTEQITVSIVNDNLINRGFEEIEKGDYIITKGKLVTTNYTRNAIAVCPKCNNEEYHPIQSEKTEIIVKEFNVIKNVSNKKAPGINEVFLIGHVCTPLIVNPTNAVGKTNCVKFKMAVTKYTNKSKSNNTESNYLTNFPFIVCFSTLASVTMKLIQPGDLVLIKGAIQERKAKQSKEHTCSECDETSNVIFYNEVREVIATKIIKDESDIPYLDELKESISQIKLPENSIVMTTDEYLSYYSQQQSLLESADSDIQPEITPSLDTETNKNPSEDVIPEPIQEEIPEKIQEEIPEEITEKITETIQESPTISPTSPIIQPTIPSNIQEYPQESIPSSNSNLTQSGTPESTQSLPPQSKPKKKRKHKPKKKKQTQIPQEKMNEEMNEKMQEKNQQQMPENNDGKIVEEKIVEKIEEIIVENKGEEIQKEKMTGQSKGKNARKKKYYRNNRRKNNRKKMVETNS